MTETPISTRQWTGQPVLRVDATHPDEHGDFEVAIFDVENHTVWAAIKCNANKPGDEWQQVTEQMLSFYQYWQTELRGT